MAEDEDKPDREEQGRHHLWWEVWSFLLDFFIMTESPNRSSGLQISCCAPPLPCNFETWLDIQNLFFFFFFIIWRLFSDYLNTGFIAIWTKYYKEKKGFHIFFSHFMSFFKIYDLIQRYSDLWCQRGGRCFFAIRVCPLRMYSLEAYFLCCKLPIEYLLSNSLQIVRFSKLHSKFKSLLHFARLKRIRHIGSTPVKVLF